MVPKLSIKILLAYGIIGSGTSFFTPFITSAIDFRFGYVFAGCNIFAAIIAYFFLMESSQRTLEEVDTMYLTRVPPRKIAKWQPSDAAELMTTDHLYLVKGGRNIQKRNEANRESVEQDEGLVAPANTDRVTEMDRNTRPVMSSG
jgi:SP family sugar:H+ symporter-like MFS transporter